MGQLQAGGIELGHSAGRAGGLRRLRRAAPQRQASRLAGPLDVLPRLTDGHYDLVFCDGDKREYAAYLKEALRLLRPGGVVAFDNALWHDRVADPAQRDAETVAIRELGKTVRESEDLLPLLVPMSDGVLVARKK